MTSAEQQQVIDERQQVINDTQHIPGRFEVTGMDEQIPDDAVTQQRAHTLPMLDAKSI